MIQNAAFTDPEDSSAWFYHTWLLGRSNARVKILAVKIHSLTEEEDPTTTTSLLRLTLVLSKGVKSNKIKVDLGDDKELRGVGNV